MYEDNAWLPEEGNLIEKEISLARMQYLHKPFEMHPSADMDSRTSEEDISKEDISREDTSESDSIMSVYSDADCPDYENWTDNEQRIASGGTVLATPQEVKRKKLL